MAWGHLEAVGRLAQGCRHSIRGIDRHARPVAGGLWALVSRLSRDRVPVFSVSIPEQAGLPAAARAAAAPAAPILLDEEAAHEADLRLLRPDPEVPPIAERRAGEYLLRLLRREEVGAAVALYDEAGERAPDPRVWDWRFFSRNPRLGLIPAAFTRAGQLVGLYPVTVRPVRVLGRDLLGSQACRTVIHPEHRGGGRVYMHLIRYIWDASCALGVPFGFGGGATEAAFKVGARFAEYRPMYDLAVREQRLSLRLAVATRGGAAAGEAARVLDLPRRLAAPRIPSGIEVAPVTEITAEFDELWERKRDRYRVLVRRDARELLWRWFRCPVPSEMLAARRGGVLEGYVVLRHFDDPEGSARLSAVVDLFSGEEPRLDAALLAAAHRSALLAGSDFLHFAPCPGSNAWQVTHGPGWRAARKAVDHVILALSCENPAGLGIADEVAAALDGRNWYYCQGDSDYWD